MPYIVAAASRFSYEEAAARLNQHIPELDIRGLILQADEAVLVENRLNKKIPIVDEVRRISKVPEGKLAAIEVALPGTSIRMLSNPYGIATLLGLDAKETKAVTPIARSLIGKKKCGGHSHPSWQYQRKCPSCRRDYFPRTEGGQCEY